MGTSIITIRIVGNHGCQREIKDGGTTKPLCDACMANGNHSGCVDAVAREMVAKLASAGSIVEANLLHWPEAGNGPKIVDDLVTGKRHGNF